MDAQIRTAKSILRKLLFWDTMGAPLKPAYHSLSSKALFRLLLIANGIRREQAGSAAVYSKGGWKISVPLSLVIDEHTHVVREFDRIFELAGAGGKAIDFGSEIHLQGMKIRTTPGMSLEFPSLLSHYHKFHAPGEGNIVFDCGAFHGLYAIAASKLVGPSGKVYCFEPDAENAKILRANLAANSVSNAIVVEKGLWETSGTVNLGGGGTTFTSVDFDSSSSSPQKIQVVSIPDFILSEGLKRVDFIKMDIEGAEIEALRGCISYMKGHALHFAIASYHLRDGTETFHAPERMFSDAGYWHKTEKGETITTYACPASEGAL